MRRTTPRRILAFALPLAFLASVGVPVRADSPPEMSPALEARRRPADVEPPKIDGRLNDEIWKHAARIDRFVQQDPTPGAEPSERTVAWVVYDSDTLWVAVRAYDREPEKIVARTMRRDESTRLDDRVAIILDTFHDHRNSYWFTTNPNSTRQDALVEGGNSFRDPWDTIWDVKSRVDSEGWTCEFEIPFKSVSFDPNNGTWGFNIVRNINRKNEEIRWSNWERSRFPMDVSEAGDLTGLQDLDQGIGLDVIPTGTLSRAEDRRVDRHFLKGDPSLDVFYKITPSVTGALTINTDFSDAPVDERQVNLDRFALFFPETRDFFLQDAGIFDFGGISRFRPGSFSFTNTNGLPFFSRRIGIADADIVELRAGLKATGRVGPLNFGVMDVQMGGYTDENGERIQGKNLSVARGKWNIGEESFVGFIATHGDPLTNSSNSTYGLDARLRTSKFQGNQIIQFDGWVQKSDTPGFGGDDESAGVLLEFPNDKWNGRIGFKRIGEDFNPALGFVNRTGIHEYIAEGRRRWRPESDTIRYWELANRSRLVTTTHGALETIESIFTYEVVGELQDFISIQSQLQTERLFESFEISEGIFIEPGRYDWARGIITVGTSERRMLSARVSASWGTFFSGTNKRSSILIGWRPSKHFQTEINYTQNQIQLETGDFTTRLLRWNVDVVISPDLSWETLIQWDRASRNLGWNSRLRWVVREGEEILLVWNQGVDTVDHDFRATTMEWTGKIRWTFRF